MVKETFVAPTPYEAFELAKKKYGTISGLKLLSARQIKDENDEIVSEITIEVPQSLFLMGIGVNEEEELLEEIEQLKDQMGALKSLVGNDGASDNIERVTRLMERKGLRREWLKKHLEPLVGTSVAEDEKLLVAYLLEEIDDALKIAKEGDESSRVRMMVGPTGVGKTTTIAKLAARYKYIIDEDMNVALVNLDTFRAGAFEQLDNFSALLGIKHEQVRTVEEFAKLLDMLSDYNPVLVDTAGISPYDTDRLIRTVEFLKSIKSMNVSVVLVLSATAKYEDMLDIYEHFSFINIESVIVTKLDETHRVGDLLAFLLEKSLPVSYICMGQKVPEDISPASKEELMAMFAGDLDV